MTTFAGGTGQAQQLPVPCGSCAGGPSTFVTHGQAGYSINGTVGTVQQQSDRAILNWQSFNVAAGHTVNFQQPTAAAVALNRIFQNDPSQIYGALNANGQVYLINQNGILFGNGAQVNVGALTASALNVSDDIFKDLGVANAITLDRAAFEGTPAADAAIQVAAGAKIDAKERVMLFAPTVENRGTILTPGGQTILAASKDKVFLASDQQLRGLLVEVDTGGSVTNLGEIVAERGNVTLAGLAVNQAGRIRATTSTSVNGSIHLLARDRATVNTVSGRKLPVATRTGTLTFDAGSVTEVLPDAGTDTAVDNQKQELSTIKGVGRAVELRSGAQLVAPGGNVSLQATSRPDQPQNGSDPTASIRVAVNAVIDVSGDDTAEVAMERNQGRIKLFGNELADSPTQRGGPLARKEIAVDLRQGTRLTDISRLRDDVKRGVGERLSVGGTVTLDAEGDLALAAGSVIDISGGQVRYRPGYIDSTQLVTVDGRVVDIAEADPNLLYSGIFGSTSVVHDKWGVVETFTLPGSRTFHDGYVEGKDAGSLMVGSRAGGVVLNGTLYANTAAGALQRNPASDDAKNPVARSYRELPLGASLSVASSRSIVFDPLQALPKFDDNGLLAADAPTVISTEQLRTSGVTRVHAESRLADIRVPQSVRLELQPGGTLDLTARNVVVEGDIKAPAGSVTIESRVNGAKGGSITLAPTAEIDVRGTWVNDRPELNAGSNGNAPLFVDGGTVTLSSQGDLTLARGSLIDVSAGAQVLANGNLDAGKAGTINLRSSIPNNNSITTLDMSGELRGYGFDSGGTLRLTAPSFLISDTVSGSAASAGQMVLASSFFQQGGFGNFELTADRGHFEVEAGTQINVSPLSMQLLDEQQSHATGADVSDLTRVTRLLDYERAPSSFTASVVRNGKFADADATLRIGTGAGITTETGGSITLRADSDLFLDGILHTPGGNIALSLLTPSAENEYGYRANQGIWVGTHARLDASGTARVITDEQGLRSGSIVDGGSVTLTANRGYIVTRSGSVIDVSGTQQAYDLPGGDFGQPVPTAIAGDAGKVRIKAGESAQLFGDMRGAAGGSGAAGGTLEVLIDEGMLDADGRAWEMHLQGAVPNFIYGDAEIRIVDRYDGDIEEGAQIPSFLNGPTSISAQRVRAGGFDALDLTVASAHDPQSKDGKIAGRIAFDGDVALSAGRRIALNAGVIASDGDAARVAAPFVSLGLSLLEPPSIATAPAAGAGTLAVEADHIDLRGHTIFSGFAQAGEQPAISLASRGDIRMIGDRITPLSNRPAANDTGSITALADVSLSAAQIYPATLTEFAIKVTGQDGRIVIDGNGAAAQTPLSAAGVLKLSASEIEQGGVLRAPFGTIELDATKQLTLAANSITSTSGAGAVIPFGQIELGEEWIYPIYSGQNNSATRAYESAPEKNIVLKAPEVSLEAGSTVDISGGGELRAYEFVKGPGGSRDVLLPNNPESSFAILPAGGAAFGVYDPLESPTAGIEPGRTITLGAGSGVPAGEYTILPARYALLPGAYLVRPVQGVSDVPPSSSYLLSDGVTQVVAGKLGYAGSDVQDARWSGFAVLNGSQVRRLSEYKEHLASKFFTGGAGTPGDAGRLTIDADRSIRIDGTLAAAAASGGRAGQVDFVADSLAVVTTRTGSTQRAELVDSELRNFSAASLLLGGSRLGVKENEEGETETELQVSAQNLMIESGTDLTAAEVLLAAKDTITVASGARVGASASTSSGARQTDYHVAAHGAFARVSSTEQSEIRRTAPVNAQLSGRLIIEDGATLAATKSITLEASRDLVSAGDLLTSGGSLSLTAALISVGEAPDATAGLVLSNDDLARFQAAELLLNSKKTIDFYGTVDANLNRVRFDAAGLRGFDDGSASSVNITANEIHLRNSAALAQGAPGTASGALALHAATLVVEATTVPKADKEPEKAGSFDLSGFASSRLVATREIVGEDESTLTAQGDLLIETPRITGAAGSTLEIEADGALTTRALAKPADLAPVTALGARLALGGASIDHGTSIEMPSGVVTLSASGADGIKLQSGSSIDVGGRDVDLVAKTVGSPGGVVNMSAAQGGVTIADNVSIDVSGASSGSSAGRVSIQSAGDAVIGSGVTLRGGAPNGQTQGTFAIIANTLSNGFSALNSLLNVGGFNERRSVAVRTGDIAIGAGESVNARVVELSTDAGNIDVIGTINAAAEQGGRVRLAASDNVTLRGSARIDARATGANQDAGDVELATRNGVVAIEATSVAQEATINVGGTQAEGRVRVRAPRVGNGVAITSLAGNVVGAKRIDLEAFQTYQATSITDPLITSIRADNTAYMSNAAAIESALGVGADSRFHLLPGVEISSTTDLSLDSAWDLIDWRDGGEVGVLTLRAEGNLNINQTLSDGFFLKPADVTHNGDPVDPRVAVATGDSWSYRLVAGAAPGGAAPLGVKPGTGNIRIGDPFGFGLTVHARTGTGEIDVAAGGNLRFTDGYAALYTVGENRGTGGVDPIAAEVILRADFVHNGGDVRVNVGGDIRGVSDRLLPDYVPRLGGHYENYMNGVIFPASWAIDASKFQGIGALGGGDVSIFAGGDMETLTVAVPTNGLAHAMDGSDTRVAGGGSMLVDVGGDIRGGVYEIGRGRADIRSGGAITNVVPGNNAEPGFLPILQLGDAQMSLQARTGLGIKTVFNTTMAPQVQDQGLQNILLFSNPNSFFLTYSADTAVSLTTIAGNTEVLADESRIDLPGHLTPIDALITAYPGSLAARSLQGDVRFVGALNLLPAANGKLEVLAGGDIIGTARARILQSDTDLSLLPSVRSPAFAYDAFLLNAALATHAPTPVHIADDEPAIIAARGTIGSARVNDLSFWTSEQTRIFAGEDVSNVTLIAQHSRPTDVSIVEAGRDVTFPLSRSPSGKFESNGGFISVAGPGRLDVIAGRDVNLGVSRGVETIGDQFNPVLADTGADLNIWTGQSTRPAYAAFVAHYLGDPTTTRYANELSQYVQRVLPEEKLTDEQKELSNLRKFSTLLPLEQQRDFIRQVFFAEIKRGGLDDFDVGFEAIATLFPNEDQSAYAGNLTSYLSFIRTRDGGNINLLVPNGMVNAGLATTTGISKQPGDIGIIAQGEGSVSAFVKHDFLVNSARVFALDGGDVLVWSSEGDIDAGRGSRAAVTIPPPVVTIDGNGNTVVSFPPAVSGSGIRNAVSTKGRKPGNVYLFAPNGVVDAGDAGIASVGDAFLRANKVIGADNIEVAGTAVGIPAETSGIGVSLSAVSSVASSASNSVDTTVGDADDKKDKAAKLADSALSWLDVFVLGLGQDVCRQDDVACLKRQPKIN